MALVRKKDGAIILPANQLQPFTATPDWVCFNDDGDTGAYMAVTQGSTSVVARCSTRQGDICATLLMTSPIDATVPLSVRGGIGYAYTADAEIISFDRSRKSVVFDNSGKTFAQVKAIGLPGDSSEVHVLAQLKANAGTFLYGLFDVTTGKPVLLQNNVYLRAPNGIIPTPSGYMLFGAVQPVPGSPFVVTRYPGGAQIFSSTSVAGVDITKFDFICAIWGQRLLLRPKRKPLPVCRRPGPACQRREPSAVRDSEPRWSRR